MHHSEEIAAGPGKGAAAGEECSAYNVGGTTAPDEHVQILRLAAADDRQWFEAQPDRNYRLCLAHVGEFLGEDGQVLAVVRQVRPGRRHTLGFRAKITPPDGDDVLAPIWDWLAGLDAQRGGPMVLLGTRP